METKQNASRDAHFAEHTCRQVTLITNVILYARVPGQSCHVGGDQASVHSRRQIVQFCCDRPLRPVRWVLDISDNSVSACAEIQLLDTSQKRIRSIFISLEDYWWSVVAPTSNVSESSNIHGRDERITSKQMR